MSFTKTYFQFEFVLIEAINQWHDWKFVQELQQDQQQQQQQEQKRIKDINIEKKGA